MESSQAKEEEEDKYDLVIEGTGLTESILAAAASWIGRKVLHVDSNIYYGSHWASLSIDQLDAWVEQNAGDSSSCL
jgi:Rab proteins geranylgeranyltransferase component A